MAECQLPKLNTRVRFPSRAPRRGDEIDVTPIFSVFMRVSGLLGPIFQNRPTVDVQPSKEQKQQKNRLLVTAQEGGFFIF